MSRTNNSRHTVFEQLEIRQLLATVNLTDFGARPNDGASDIAAIQAAHRATGPGDTLVFPSGVLDIPGGMKVSGQRIYQGQNGSILRGRHAQGYLLLRSAARQYSWNLNYGGIALVWRGGCIIRSAFLGDIKKAFDRNPGLDNLLLDDFFRDAVMSRQEAWRRAIVAAVQSGIPVPCLSAALAYFDGYRSARLPANLLQAQRDYFGAHTYERTDQPRGQFFHTDWTGHGGATTSRSYSA